MKNTFIVIYNMFFGFIQLPVELALFRLKLKLFNK